MNVAEKVAKSINEKRLDVQEQARITNLFPTKKKVLVEQLKAFFTSFYNQVSAYVNEGNYFTKEINEEKNEFIYLYNDKLITVLFADSKEEDSYFRAIVKVDNPVIRDVVYELNVKYNDGFSWYHEEKALTSETFDEFMDEILFKDPF